MTHQPAFFRNATIPSLSAVLVEKLCILLKCIFFSLTLIRIIDSPGFDIWIFGAYCIDHNLSVFI